MKCQINEMDGRKYNGREDVQERKESEGEESQRTRRARECNVTREDTKKWMDGVI